MPGRSVDDIALAEARYEELDRPGNPVRIRLMSTAVRVVNGDGVVEVGVIANGSLHRLRARHVVLACFNMLVPYALGGLPAAQAAALRQNVKMPLVYSNVLVRDWRAWQRLGVHEIYGVSSFHSRVKLGYPVSMGAYRCSRDPGEPIVLHLVHVPVVPGIDDPRAALRAARRLLLTRRFEDYETAIRTDLSRMLGPGGFDAARDMLAITVNRWSHGYSWGPNTLVDDWDEHEAVIETARRPMGRVTIANSDSVVGVCARSDRRSQAGGGRAAGGLTGPGALVALRLVRTAENRPNLYDPADRQAGTPGPAVAHAGSAPGRTLATVRSVIRRPNRQKSVLDPGLETRTIRVPRRRKACRRHSRASVSGRSSCTALPNRDSPNPRHYRGRRFRPSWPGEISWRSQGMARGGRSRTGCPCCSACATTRSRTRGPRHARSS